MQPLSTPPSPSTINTHQIFLKPPEIIVAENGFVVKQYDVGGDGFTHKIAANTQELRVIMEHWADGVCNALHRMVDSRISALTADKPRETNAA